MSHFRIVNPYFSRVKKTKFLAGLWSVLFTGISMLLIASLQLVLDAVIGGSYDELRSLLWQLGGVLSVYFVLTLLSQYYFRKLEFTAGISIISGMFGQSLLHPLSFYRENASGEIASRIQNDSKSIAAWRGPVSLSAFWQAITLIGVLLLMAYYNVYITLSVLTLSILLFLIMRRISTYIAQASQELQVISADVSQEIIQSLQGIAEVRQFQKEKFFSERLDRKLFKTQLPIGIRLSKYYAIYVSLAIFLSFILPALGVAMGAWFVMRDQMSIGSVLAMYALIGQVQEPVRVLADAISARKVALAMVERNHALLSIKPETKEEEKPMAPLKELSVSINDFRYEENEPLLKNISLALKPGDTLFLQGESGSGKSTIANLMMRFEKMPDQSGSITWNDEPIADIPKKSYYNKVLMTKQSPYLFKGTIRENLLLGESYTDQEMIRALQVSCLDTFIQKVGLDHMLTEGGSNLSGGQKQRLALARVLLRKPELLILDEPTSALNAMLSAALMKNIREYTALHKMASLIITHDTSLIGESEQLLIL